MTADPNDDPIEWQLVDTDLTTVISILPTATSSSLYLEKNEPGSGELKVPLLSNVAYLIESGQFVRCKYRGAVRGGFFVENINKSLVNSGEGGELWVSVSGRGALALLDDAVVWTDGTPETTREFTDKKKAEILITLLDEAQERGSLSQLTYDFTASVDSDGETWTDSETMQFTVGKSLLDVVREMAELGVDFTISIETDGTFNLSAWKNGTGTDKSDFIYFRRGSNCVEVSSTEAGGEIKNATLIKYDGGFSYVSDPTSISARRRREGIVDAIDAFNSDHALTYGSAKIEFSKNPKAEMSLNVYDGIGTRVFLDYDLGDYTTLDMSGVETVNRIKSLQLTWDMTEKASVIVGLNSTVYENDIRQSNDIRKLQEAWRRAHDGKKVNIPFWAALGSLNDLATDGSYVYKVAVSDAGILYVSGNITKVGNVSVGYAARYDVNSGVWSKLGDGFDAIPLAIECVGTDIYFGGGFTTADGVTCAYHLARWDEGTETFDATGAAGSITAVHALHFADPILYVGGAGADGGETGFVGYLDTGDDSWHEMPGVVESISPIAYSIAANGTRVYIGDDATGGSGLRVWDTGTETWDIIATIDAPSYGIIYDLKVYNGYLYIGGDFAGLSSIADTVALARMDLATETVEAFDGGLTTAYTDKVFAFAVNGSELIIGGHFSSIGAGFTTSNIVSWNAGIWQNLDTGLDGNCYGLTVYQGNIGVGGAFTHAGGKPIKFVGAYITNLEELVNYLETGSGNSSSGYTHPNHSGDVTSVGDGAQTIALNVVDNTKLANMAEGTVKARTTAGTGDPEDITLASLATALGVPFGLTASRVAITDGSGNITVDAQLTYDASTNQLQVGAGSAVSANDSIMQAADGASTGHILTSWGTAVASYVRGIFARGTKASPTAAQADDPEFKLRGAAHDGSTYPSSNTEIRFVANENQSSGAHGGRVEIWTTPDASTTLTKAFTVQADGNVNIESGKTYNINGSPMTGGGAVFDRTLDADLTMEDNASLVVAEYIDAGAFTITLTGDAAIALIGGGTYPIRTLQITSSATPTINTDLYDVVEITAQAADITSMTTNLTGTPGRNQQLLFYITGTAARAITWGSAFESGIASLPATTITTETLEVAFRRNGATSKWRCSATGSAA